VLLLRKACAAVGHVGPQLLGASAGAALLGAACFGSTMILEFCVQVVCDTVHVCVCVCHHSLSHGVFVCQGKALKFKLHCELSSILENLIELCSTSGH
jgi:hypothetical protein